MELSEYLLKTYSFEEACDKFANQEHMTEFDDKMQKAIKKMKECYNKHNNRKSIIVLKYDEVINMQNKAMTKKSSSKNAQKKTEPLICKAIKMNNEKCTAKAKPNCEFCGRHMPKHKS